ncbi:hypothetical protein [Beggiatoa leptomitoformis]|uniref:hypothetical protein n=1 Tax=Beggiatoa leptomitoformis TaxID=288004 RepID=UPI00191FFACB|nr:hypothetical protein [Beggiatoa leptomitoformis]
MFKIPKNDWTINVMLAERVANWYESGIQKGVQQGKLEGKAEGKLEGKAEGKAEGKLEGIVEGIVRGRTEGIKTALLAILTMRFGEVPSTAQQAIDAIHDTERLEQLMREAIVVDSLATFLQQRIND